MFRKERSVPLHSRILVAINELIKIHNSFSLNSTKDNRGANSLFDAAKKPDIEFTGSFAIITTNKSGELKNMYIGDGDKLRFGNVELEPKTPVKSAYREYLK